MDISVFTDKAFVPTSIELKNALGEKMRWWHEIRDFAFEKYPKAVEEWNYPGKNYGWSFRVKDKKRAIVYLLPCDGSFKVAFVFGAKAFEKVLLSPVADSIKQDLCDARPYAEGRGISIDVTGDSVIADIKKLIEIKLAN